MSKQRLLLADDSITIQKVVNLTFADEGIEVIAVGDGNSAMEKFVEATPDLVMVDVNMPGLDGYRICEMIKQDDETKHVPVILLVGSFEPFDEDEARRVGANDYLTKPFQSIRQLVNKVTVLLNAGSNRPEVAAESVPAVEPAYKTEEVIHDTIDPLGDAGMDDDMIHSDQIGSIPVPDFQKLETKTGTEEVTKSESSIYKVSDESILEPFKDAAETQQFTEEEFREVSDLESGPTTADVVELNEAEETFVDDRATSLENQMVSEFAVEDKRTLSELDAELHEPEVEESQKWWEADSRSDSPESIVEDHGIQESDEIEAVEIQSEDEIAEHLDEKHDSSGAWEIYEEPETAKEFETVEPISFVEDAIHSFETHTVEEIDQAPEEFVGSESVESVESVEVVETVFSEPEPESEFQNLHVVEPTAEAEVVENSDQSADLVSEEAEAEPVDGFETLRSLPPLKFESAEQYFRNDLADEVESQDTVESVYEFKSESEDVENLVDEEFVEEAEITSVDDVVYAEDESITSEIPGPIPTVEEDEISEEHEASEMEVRQEVQIPSPISQIEENELVEEPVQAEPVAEESNVGPTTEEVSPIQEVPFTEFEPVQATTASPVKSLVSTKDTSEAVESVIVSEFARHSISLSSEAVETIASRIADKISEKIVQQLATDVVSDLADLIADRMEQRKLK